jgi:hypothetical protein
LRDKNSFLFRKAPAMSVFRFLRALMLAAPLALAALPAAAQCYADYRAQRTSPVQFHYGVVQLPANACGDAAAAARHLAPRLQRDGWTLVDILSTFGPEGLASRQGRAGQFYLRY